ncbi:hypothetical protein, partial [Flavobacterium sp. HSC-61S13]|uniref:beta strand repeat-containing protein n=1 Tax=Flavobacterium sp. HSC-61S13 TaxID=2910963 RepID=UPI0020A20592
YAAGTMTYLNEAGTSVTVDIKAMVAAGAETITTLINNGKGKYTYTSEDKTVTVIDVPADVINNFEEIIKNKTVLEQLITYLTNTYVGGNVYYDGTKFTYVDKQGNVHNITFEDIVQANETLTILAFNQATGILTYQDEKKNITSIDIKSAIDSFETITTLTADYTAGTITYLNEASNPVTVDIKAMVAAGAETITTLINNGKGKYTYTSEDKTVTVIDVPEDVINNFEEIIKNKTVLEQLITYLTNTYVGGNVYYDGTQFTYVDKQGNVHNITFEDIVQANETLTILAFNQATGILTYQDEKKNITSIDIKSAIDSFETITTLTADYTAGTITYLNEASNPVTVDIKAMVAAGAETITTLINNGKGKYTYTSEDKTVTVIDVPADVINNFEEIIKNKTVLEQLITYLTNTYVGGNVYYDGTQFTYVDKQGNVHNIIFEDIVQANETLTILAFNQATGILTYQDEKKNITSIDIKSAIDSFETITTLTADYNAGTITYLNEASNPVTVDIKSMVAAGAETITTLTKGANGTYVYKSENGTLTTIDVPADVISNFTQIIQDPTVLQKLILNLTGTYVGGNVYYDGTKFTYVDQAGAVHNINLEQIVQANETLTILGYTPATGILTYQDEKKNVTSVDIKAAVKSFETLTSLSANAANGTITFKDEAGNSTTINIKDLVGMSETITTFVKNGNGTYTYKNEADVTTTIDPSMVNVTYANGIYTFKDNLGNNLTEINTNASNIIYNNNTSGLTAVNVQNAIDELVLKLNNVPTTKGSITGTGITVTNGNNATLRDVQVAITPGAAGQVLVTNASATATEWIDKANFIPTISNTLTKEGTNTLVSTVNGVVAKANLVESVVNAITGSSLVTTVNGVASTALDLTNAIQAGQKTVTVVDGENTTVSSSTGNNNTEYKVNVSKAAIQAAQKTTVVAAGTGVTVTPDTNGDITTYTVATSGTTAVTLAGDVTGPTTNTKVERIQTVPVSAIAPRNNEVLTFDGTNWKPALPTVDAGTITNGKAFTSTDLDLQGDPSTSLLKAVSANIKTGAVTSEKILDGTIRPIDMNSEGNNLVLTTDASGRPTWINKADLNQANQKTSSVTSTTADLVVTPKVGGDNTNYELTLKSAMPKFFYMPAVIFDTNTNGVRTKNLYAEYTAQFGLGGGMIASAGSSGSIPVLGSSELEFYVTYYDPAVFSNLSITADGILTYTVIGKATRASYMNIVFVVK